MKFKEKFAIWFSENEGGVKGRLEFSRKFIQFGTVTHFDYESAKGLLNK